MFYCIKAGSEMILPFLFIELTITIRKQPFFVFQVSIFLLLSVNLTLLFSYSIYPGKCEKNNGQVTEIINGSCYVSADGSYPYPGL